MLDESPQEVLIIGGGPAGLSTSIFTARHGLDTLLIDSEGSILRRNAHLENFPGFPAGVNARQLLDLMSQQAEQAGVSTLSGRVSKVEQTEDGFTVETEANDRLRSQYVVAATKNAVEFLRGIDGVGFLDRGKTYVDTDERGRTGVNGLYAAGRLAEKPHQAIVCAGHGAEVGVTILEDDDRPFYHDWVAPDGYFTDRDREVPPGCEEIDETERAQREAESLRVMQRAFEKRHPDEQETHPSLRE